MADEARVITAFEGGIATVVLHNPERGNSLSRPIYEQLNAAYEWIKTDPEVRAVVFTASGERHFCTGADTNALGGVLRSPGEDFTLTWRQARVTKPVVVAVNGTVAGGGLTFVADGDIVVAPRGVRFIDPHVKIGQLNAYSAPRLATIIGPSEANRLVLAGGVLDTERAHTLGLVNELTGSAAEAKQRARELAEAIAAASPEAVRVTYELMRMQVDADDRRRGLAAADVAWAQHFAHPDAAEGLRAAAEKRPARWATAEGV